MQSAAEPTIDDYLTGARNCCRFAGVGPGHQVLLLPTAEFLAADPLTLEALKQAAQELGGEVTIAIIDALGTRGNPPRQLARAIESSDVFIGMGDRLANPITGHALTALKARWDYGARQLDIRGGKGMLATECATYPNEILLAIVGSMHARLKSAGRLEIADDKGTRLRLPYNPHAIYYGGTFGVDHMGPGQRTTWPLGHFMIHPEIAFSGVAMADCIRGLPRVLDQPIRCLIENCAVEFEDREETRRVRTEMAKPGNASYVNTFYLGFNPKGSVTRGVRRSDFGELRPAAGVINIGVGDRQGYVSSNFNTGIILLDATIMVDGRTFSERGRLTALDDPEVRRVAAKYGDADRLLSQALYD